MDGYSASARRSGRKTGGGFGSLVVLWLNLAVAPCAMALEAGHDCDHCPPAAAEREHAGHHGHTAAPAGKPCAEIAAQCCDAATFTVESRYARQLSDDGPGVIAVPADGYESLIDLAGVYFVTPAPPPDPPGARTPLHVLNCVFLD